MNVDVQIPVGAVDHSVRAVVFDPVRHFHGWFQLPMEADPQSRTVLENFRSSEPRSMV